jgi:hypothetical protein
MAEMTAWATPQEPKTCDRQSLEAGSGAVPVGGPAQPQGQPPGWGGRSYPEALRSTVDELGPLSKGSDQEGGKTGGLGG